MKRNKQTLFLALTTTLLLSAIHVGRADDHAKDKVLIRSAMNKMAIAFEKKDADGYVAFTDPKIVNVNLSCKETTHGKKERLANLSKLFAQVSTIQLAQRQ